MAVNLRPATDADFDACRRIYFAEMEWINERLGLRRDSQEASFKEYWDTSQVRMIQLDGADVGWLQVVPGDGEIFVGSIYVEGAFQCRGIGTEVMKQVLDEGARRGHLVRLAVVKFNPARRLYERLGFHVTHEDDRKVYMSRDPDPAI